VCARAPCIFNFTLQYCIDNPTMTKKRPKHVAIPK